jgi:SOS-response transcriptional repressor LexA
VLRTLFRDRERFELWSGLTFFTLSLLLFLAGWFALRGSALAWVNVPAGALATLGLLGLSGKVPLSSLLLNRGLAAYEPKRGGQIAVLYGAALFGLGVFGLSSLPYAWLAASGAYGLAALLGSALILGGLYIVASTPVIEPTGGVTFEADDLLPGDPAAMPGDPVVPWYVIEDEAEVPAAEASAAQLLPRSVEARYAVPQVRREAAAKRPALLTADDIVAYAMIECDWVETPTNYTCLSVEAPGMAPVVESGDIVGINHAIVDPQWLRGKLVAALRQGQGVTIGFLRHTADHWFLQPREESAEAVPVELVGLIGAVEWSLKPGSKHLLPPAEKQAQSTAFQAAQAYAAERRPSA